jgi:hypothetical protein
MSVELQSFSRLQTLGTVDGILVCDSYVVPSFRAANRNGFHRLLMHAATKQQRHISGEKRPRLTFCFAVQSLGMNVRERLPSVFLEIRMHWFIYSKNYCSYLVAISLPCFLFSCSISWGMNVRERLPLVFLEIRMHWFIYLKNYCSYLVAMSFQSCFFFAFRSVSCG